MDQSNATLPQSFKTFKDLLDSEHLLKQSLTVPDTDGNFFSVKPPLFLHKAYQYPVFRNQET